MITPRSLTGGVVIARIFNEDFMWRLTQMPFYHIQSHIESTFIYKVSKLIIKTSFIVTNRVK
jgi:hypothetical protein